MKIIHSPSELTKLSKEEIDELLLDDSYNKANLRQLTRVAINTIKEQQKLLDMYKRKRNESQDKFEDLRDDVFKVFDKYR